MPQRAPQRVPAGPLRTLRTLRTHQVAHDVGVVKLLQQLHLLLHRPNVLLHFLGLGAAPRDVHLGWRGPAARGTRLQQPALQQHASPLPQLALQGPTSRSPELPLPSHFPFPKTACLLHWRSALPQRENTHASFPTRRLPPRNTRAPPSPQSAPLCRCPWPQTRSQRRPAPPARHASS